jgi:hypothetical protein
MELTIPLDEAMLAARATGKVPSAVHDLRGEPAAVLASVAVHELPDVSGPLRTMARLAGPAAVRVDDEGVADRRWRLAVTATHPVARFDLSSMVANAVRSALKDVPPGIVSVTTADGRTLIDVDLDAAAALVASLLPSSFAALRVHVDDARLGTAIRLTATLT